MRVSVDASRCEGSGLCARALPTVFQIGAEGLAHADPEAGGAAPLAELEEIEVLCPTGAIVLDPDADE